jgi:hypothetical protein
MELHVTPNHTPTRMTAWLEQEWLVRYLDRRLASEEASWFEAYVLDKPELLATIEADTRWRDALAVDASTRHTDRSVARGGRPGGATAAAAPGDTGQDAGSDAAELGAMHDALPARRRPLRGLSALPLAACLLFGVSLGAVGTRTLWAPQIPAVIGSPTRVVFDTMRGAPEPPRVEHPDSTAAYLLVEVAVPTGAEQIVLHVAGEPDQPLGVAPDGFVTSLISRTPTHAQARLTYRVADAEHVVTLDHPQAR